MHGGRFGFLGLSIAEVSRHSFAMPCRCVALEQQGKDEAIQGQSERPNIASELNCLGADALGKMMSVATNW